MAVSDVGTRSGPRSPKADPPPLFRAPAGEDPVAGRLSRGRHPGPDAAPRVFPSRVVRCARVFSPLARDHQSSLAVLRGNEVIVAAGLSPGRDGEALPDDGVLANGSSRLAGSPLALLPRGGLGGARWDAGLRTSARSVRSALVSSTTSPVIGLTPVRSRLWADRVVATSRVRVATRVVRLARVANVGALGGAGFAAHDPPELKRLALAGFERKRERPRVRRGRTLPLR